MSHFGLSREAYEDIDSIWDYIARDSVDSADRVRDELFDAFRTLASHPEMGHIKSDWTDQPVRFWQVQPYVVVYDARTNPLYIVRVLHCARNIPEVLGGASQ